MKDIIEKITNNMLSHRDNMLVENERISIYHRPVRDGRWENPHLKMSRMGLNMYNPLQAKRSWGYKMTSTLSELRSSSICHHNNHSNHINHSSDNKGRKGEGAKGTNNEHFLVACLPVACCLLLAACSLVHSFTKLK